VSDANGNGKKFDWRMAAFVVLSWLASACIQYGITEATMVDHSRRLDSIEHRLDEKSITREEYDRRHEDLIRQMGELRTEVLDLERKQK
jgi:septal ring factor EnvC (AmiA/AmiB activator)